MRSAFQAKCILSLGLFIAMAMMTMQVACAQNPQVYDYRLGLPEIGPGPQLPLGSLAPDFTLPRLSSFVAREGKPPVGMTTLSAYRGKKVVVLISTAYT